MVDPSLLLAIAFKTSLLLMVVAIACTALTRHSAAYRHFLWSCALALSLLMPLAVTYLPSWAVIPALWQPDAASIAGTGESVSLMQGVGFLSGAGVVIVWLVGALGLLFRDVLAAVGLLRWFRRARPLSSAQWTSTLHGLSREPGIDRPLRVLESAHVTSPCTWGLVRPVLLLPVSGAGWPESQRRDALLHELAHVRRFDYLSALVARLACALHWYNPLVWWAAAQQRRLQEQACDDAVLRGGGTPSAYAQFLLDVAGGSRHERGSLRFALGMMRRSSLHDRVVAILDSHRTRLQPGRFALLGAVVSLCSLTIVLAAAATVPQVKEEQLPAPASSAAPAAESAAAALAAAATEARPATQVRPTQTTTEDSVTRGPAETPAPSEGRPRQPLVPLPPLEPLKPLPVLEPIPPVPPVPGAPVPPEGPASRAHQDSRPLETRPLETQ